MCIGADWMSQDPDPEAHQVVDLHFDRDMPELGGRRETDIWLMRSEMEMLHPDYHSWSQEHIRVHLIQEAGNPLMMGLVARASSFSWGPDPKPEERYRSTPRSDGRGWRWPYLDLEEVPLPAVVVDDRRSRK